uniref:Protein translocase subunit SecY n=1 Tax=Ignisphaera aggregans TaxID=334771 RepID=A0A7J2TZH1_9CREN
MGIIELLAKIGQIIPSAPRPVKKVSLGKRLVFTVLVAIAYIMLASTKLYGIQTAGRGTLSPIISIILAMQSGTFAQLGIGPVVTSGMILQILVGAKILDMDLNDPEDRKNFTLASKGLGIVLAIVEATGFAVSGIYWYIPQSVPIWIKIAVVLQLIWGGIIIIMLDEAVQKGWGMGSGVSLFILIGVAWRFFSELLTPYPVQSSGEIYGLIPYIITMVKNGVLNFWYIFIGRLAGGYPTIVGLITSLILIIILSYLNAAKINIPIVISRYGGMKTRVPLQLLYVTNIPVLLTGILISDIILFLNLLQNYIGTSTISTVQAYLTPPTLYHFMYMPWASITYTVIFFILCVLFGLLWVEIAGLNPEAQAENLINAGLDIPGMRRNPRVLASYLSRYIYPLTVFSSIVVAVISLVGDIFGCYGTGTGILLAVGILFNYYQMLLYERTIEMYPVLKRFIGE